MITESHIQMIGSVDDIIRQYAGMVEILGKIVLSMVDRGGMSEEEQRLLADYNTKVKSLRYYINKYQFHYKNISE